jgi:hypothetical protein
MLLLLHTFALAVLRLGHETAQIAAAARALTYPTVGIKHSRVGRILIKFCTAGVR